MFEEQYKSLLLNQDQGEGGGSVVEDSPGSTAQPAGDVLPAGVSDPPPVDQKPPEGTEDTVESLRSRVEQLVGEKRKLEGDHKQFRTNLDRMAWQEKSKPKPAATAPPPTAPREPSEYDGLPDDVRALLESNDPTALYVHKMFKSMMGSVTERQDKFEQGAVQERQHREASAKGTQINDMLDRVEDDLAAQIGAFPEGMAPEVSKGLTLFIDGAVSKAMVQRHGQDHFIKAITGDIPMQFYIQDHQDAYNVAYREALGSVTGWHGKIRSGTQDKLDAADDAQSAMLGRDGAAVSPEHSEDLARLRKGELSPHKFLEDGVKALRIKK